MFFKEKIIYTDILEEWRKVKIWDFYLFDKVIWESSKNPLVIVGEDKETVYKHNEKFIKNFMDWKWDASKLRWWILDDEWKSYENIIYSVYKCIDRKWTSINLYAPKKYYWEFQQEFESLDKAVKDEQELKKKILEIQQLEKSMNENYEKARKIQGKNYKELWIL